MSIKLSLVSALRVSVDKRQACHRQAELIGLIVPNPDFEFHYKQFSVLTFVEQVFLCHRTLNRFRDGHFRKMDVRQVLKVGVQRLANRARRQRLSILGCL